MRSTDKGFDSSRLLLLPVAAVLGLVPLVVRAYPYRTGLEKYPYYGTDGYAIDIFLHGKMVLFLIICGIMAVICAVRLCLNRTKDGSAKKAAVRDPFLKVLLPLFAYAGLALLSSIFSSWQPYPWTGIFLQFESCFVLLGYVLTAYYAYLSVRDETDIRLLLASLGFSAIIMVAIGFSQAFFTDFFQTEAGIKLMIPGRYYQQFKEGGGEVYPRFKIWKVCMTLMNPNYVGSYVPLVLPVALMTIFAVKKLWIRIGAGLLCAGLLVCLFGSGSRTGFIALVISLAVLVLIFAKKDRRFGIPVAAVAVLFGALLLLFGLRANTGFFERIGTVLSFETYEPALQGIRTTDNDVQLIYKGRTLHIRYEDGEEGVTITCSDDTGRYFDLIPDAAGEHVTIDDPGFSDITIAPAQLTDEVAGFEVFAGREWYFTRFEDGYYFFTPYGKFIKHDVSKAWKWLDLHGFFATGRGFTWARTIPLLGRCILLGSGADTFQLVFPNDDFVASYNSTNWGYVVTKPHCMYLQIAVQTGILSLICVLAYLCAFAAVCIKAFRTSSKEAADTPAGKKTPAKQPGSSFSRLICGGILAGVAGYMAAAFFNDSTVCIAPVFWTLTGIGLAAAKLGRTSALEKK